MSTADDDSRGTFADVVLESAVVAEVESTLLVVGGHLSCGPDIVQLFLVLGFFVNLGAVFSSIFLFHFTFRLSHDFHVFTLSI